MDGVYISKPDPVHRWSKVLDSIDCSGNRAKAIFLEDVHNFIQEDPYLKPEIVELFPTIIRMIRHSTKLEHDPTFTCSTPLIAEKSREDMRQFYAPATGANLIDSFPQGIHAYLIIGKLECYLDASIFSPKILKIHYAVL